MSTWHCKNLGDAMLAGPQLERLRVEFEAAFAQAGCPESMALFLRHESEGRLHCEVMVYFSPVAYSVAESAGAQICRRPEMDGLSLLEGHPKVWQRLFSDFPSCKKRASDSHRKGD